MKLGRVLTCMRWSRAQADYWRWIFHMPGFAWPFGCRRAVACADRCVAGAAALGDIGTHFPDSDARYAGADSRVLLRETWKMLHEQGYRVVNVDATIMPRYRKWRHISRRWSPTLLPIWHCCRRTST